jgi:16S rRNA (cytosine1402-N4)-methyltransferase
MTKSMPYHIPVLFHSSLEWLNLQADGLYVDLTYGGGGHSKGILDRIGNAGRLVAFDQDPDAAENVISDSRLTFVPHRFDQLASRLQTLSIGAPDGILADLGISSHQIDTPERGFSYRYDAALDMRMNPEEEYTAAKVLNTLEHPELARMFRTYGDLDQASKIATLVLGYREGKAFERVGDLLAALERITPRHQPAAFLSRVFQALRIEVNHEMEVLESMLKQALEVLKPGGRLVIISYHSLEDRMVKHFFRSGNFQDEVIKDFYGNPLSPWKVLTRHPVVPEADEIENNPRARSAKLRVAEKKSLI